MKKLIRRILEATVKMTQVWSYRIQEPQSTLLPPQLLPTKQEHQLQQYQIHPRLQIRGRRPRPCQPLPSIHSSVLFILFLFFYDVVAVTSSTDAGSVNNVNNNDVTRSKVLYRSGHIVSCGGCQLNYHQPLKLFLKEGDAELYEYINVTYIKGARAVLTIYDHMVGDTDPHRGKKVEDIELVPLSKSKMALHQLLQSKGFRFRKNPDLNKIKDPETRQYVMNALGLNYTTNRNMKQYYNDGESSNQQPAGNYDDPLPNDVPGRFVITRIGPMIVLVWWLVVKGLKKPKSDKDQKLMIDDVSTGSRSGSSRNGLSGSTRRSTRRSQR